MKQYKVKFIINIILFTIVIAEISAIATYFFSGNLRPVKTENRVHLKWEISKDKKYGVIIDANISSYENEPSFIFIDPYKRDGGVARGLEISIKQPSDKSISADDFKIEWHKEYVKVYISNYYKEGSTSYRFYYEDM